MLSCRFKVSVAPDLAGQRRAFATLEGSCLEKRARLVLLRCVRWVIPMPTRLEAAGGQFLNMGSGAANSWI